MLRVFWEREAEGSVGSSFQAFRKHWLRNMVHECCSPINETVMHVFSILSPSLRAMYTGHMRQGQVWRWQLPG